MSHVDWIVLCVTLGLVVLHGLWRSRGRSGLHQYLLAGEAVIFACWYFTAIAFLWYNVLGCLAVVATGLLITACDRRRDTEEPAPPARIAGFEGER